MANIDMQKLALILFFIVFSFTAYAQKYKSDRIYWIALDKYTKAINSSNRGGINTNDTVFLEKPQSVDSLPSKLNGLTIVLITRINQKNLYQSHKKSLTHTIMSSIIVEDSLLYINFIPYAGKLKGSRHYFLSEGGGTTVYFKFNCDKKRYVIDEVKGWGI